jgi:UDP-glucose 4-epimerase
MNNKIIITGGMGFIGSHTVVELYYAGFTPVIIDNLSNSNESVKDGIQKIIGQEVIFEKLDLKDKEATKNCFGKHKDAKGVIHFAAHKAVGDSVKHPLKYYNNNINGLLNVLLAMQEFDIDNLIFSSSCTVYGVADVLPVTEKSPIKPAFSPYGYTKQVGEAIITDFTVANASKKAISLRYFNPIGAHSSTEIGELPLGTPENLMPYITQTAAGLRKELSVFGDDYNTPDGTAIRDYIHVCDLAEAHVIAMLRLLEHNNLNSHEFFNIGTGKGYSVLDVIKSFEKTSGQKLNYKIVDRRPGDLETIYADTTFSKETLGWEAKLGLDDMTLSAWNWEKKINGIP